MRRTAAMVIGLVVVLAGIGAHAAEASAPEVSQAWTRSSVVPTFVSEAGRLYVAADAGLEAARTFVHADIDDTTSAPAEIVLVEVDGAPLADGAEVQVCPLTTPLIGDGEVSAERAPAADCTDAPRVSRAPTGWVIPLPASPYGVALVPVTDEAATFRLVFDAERTAVRLPDVAPDPTATGDAAAPSSAGNPTPPVVPPSPSVDLPALDLPAVDAAAPVADVGGGDTIATAPAASSGVVPSTPLPTFVLRTAASPPALAVLLPLAGVTAGGLLLRRRRLLAAGGDVDVDAATAARSISGNALATLLGAVALVVVPTLFAEVTTYKIGLVLIVIVAAAGLHVLVNWTGELSLGHAAMVGFPAFTVAKLSADHGLSPVLLLPVGLAAGAAVGAAVGLPALRARGIQVALVTLAGSVAIDRFFFTKTWFVGEAAGAAVSTPTLGPIELRTSRSLYVLLAVVFLVAIGAAWTLYRSKLARGMHWISANPAAAAAFGIPVNRYRVLAYVVAGAYAGLAGGLTAMWVQRLTPQAFPQSQSFTYLVIVALAGRGFLGGVALAALAIEGGRLLITGSDALIAYGAPLGLILSLTSYRHGLNGLLARARRFITERLEVLVVNGSRIALGLAGIAGIVAVVIGFGAISVAWYHAGNTRDTFVQNQEMLSGGIGGLALVILGTGLFIADRLVATRSPR